MTKRQLIDEQKKLLDESKKLMQQGNVSEGMKKMDEFIKLGERYLSERREQGIQR